jgi:hypothetical protein
MLTTILLVFALVFFALSAFGAPLPPRFNLIAAGLAFWVASVLFGGYTHTGWH